MRVIVFLSLLLCAAFYAGIGLLFHWVLLGDTVNYASAGSLGVIIGWPLILTAAMIVFAFAILAGVLVYSAVQEKFFPNEFEQLTKEIRKRR